MKRKLCALLLCAFSLLLLMGAGVENDQPDQALTLEETSASLPAEETSEPQSGADIETESSDTAEEAQQPQVSVDPTLLIDGQPAPAATGKSIRSGTTIVALKETALALEPEANVAWNSGDSTVTVTTGSLTLTAQVGQKYVVANGRYLYIPQGVTLENGVAMIPLKVLCEAFDAQLSWDAATGAVSVKRGSGALTSGDSYYDQEALFWLSRIVHAESGNQPLEGKMAVALVVLNRVESPLFPNTVEGVLAQKNQFTTYRSGALAYVTPNAQSVVAAKLVLDGGEVEAVADALYFDSSSNSWASRNRPYAATIGNHKFYE